MIEILQSSFFPTVIIAQEMTLCADQIYTIVHFVSSSSTIDPIMVAKGSVGTGSSVTDFPFAWLESVNFLACCGISYVISVFGLSC